MKQSKLKLNVRLLQRIKQHILTEPNRLYMSWFVKTGSPGQQFTSDGGDLQTLPNCGTAACIAGWANLLTRGNNPCDYRRAVARLGLPEYRRAIFDVPFWPAPFKRNYRNAGTAMARAKIAAARIEHLIKTGE